MRRNLLKSKRSQGVFGISFGMIFSILLMVFFLVAAFMAVRFFLNYKKQAEIGLFIDELQNEIDKAWNSPSSSTTFESNLPSGIEYVCFINMSAPPSSDTIGNQIYNDVRFGSYDNNFVFYPIKSAGSLSHIVLEHFKMREENPYCIGVQGNTVNIKIEKSFEQALPEVS